MKQSYTVKQAVRIGDVDHDEGAVVELEAGVAKYLVLSEHLEPRAAEMAAGEEVAAQAGGPDASGGRRRRGEKKAEEGSR